MLAASFHNRPPTMHLPSFVPALLATLLSGFAAAAGGADSSAPARGTPPGATLSFVDGGELLDENPSRGPASGNWTVLRRNGSAKPSNPTRFFSKLWDLSEYSGGNTLEKKSPKPGRMGGADIPLDEAALSTIRQTLANARANGAQGILRFGYAWDDTIGSEPSNPAMIRTHIAQLGAVLREFPDVVLAVEGGMFGPWGEMNYSGYVAPERSVPIMNAWLEELPATASLLVRSPCYLLWHAGMDSAAFDAATREGRLDYPGADRLGMYNDGYLGSMSDLGTWHGDPPPASGLTREMGVRWLATRKGGIPYGGEFGYCGLNWVTNNGPLCNPKLNIVEEWYRTHLTYLRDFGAHQTIATFLSTLTLDASLTNFPGAPRLDEWIGRDLRSFVRAHLGYRFVARDLDMPAAAHPGDALRLSLAIENTGFNDIAWPTKASLILAPAASSVSASVADAVASSATASVADAVDSSTASSAAPCAVPLDLREAHSGETTVFPIGTTLPPDLPPGDYDMLLDIRLDLPRPEGTKGTDSSIRLANAGAWDDARAANRLGTLRVR